MGVYEQITYYSSIASGVLLVVSEILPYVKVIEGNGLIDMLLRNINNIKNKKNNNYEVIPDVISNENNNSAIDNVEVGVQFDDNTRNKILQERIEKLSKHIYELKECLDKLK